MVKYGDISPRTAAYASKEMLERAQPHLIMQPFAQVRPIPKNASDTIKFRRYNALAVATTPLSEGVTPTGSALTSEDVTAVLAQYGDFVPLTDVIADTHEDPIFREVQAIMGEQAAQTVETLLYGVLSACTNVVYANGAANRAAVATAPSVNDLRNCIRALKRQNARFITSMVSGSANFNTESVAPAFIAFIHPDLEPALRGLSGFIDVKDYGGKSPYPTEIGAFESIRFLTSTLQTSVANGGAASAGTDFVSTNGTNVDIYRTIIVGQNSYATVPLKGATALTPMVLNPGVPREGDPLGQRGYVSWKTYWAGCILNDAWMVILESGAPALGADGVA